MIVAVDGPSGAGKSTVCREVARRLQWRLLDTGAIYRCVALRARLANVVDEPAKCAEIAKDIDIRFVASAEGQRVFIGDEDVSEAIRTFETTQCVNRVSAMGEVRAQLLNIQRRLGALGDTIVEGRDIGSVVFPDAELKVFYTATPEARARRRLAEFEKRGESFNFEQVVEQIRLRDFCDLIAKQKSLFVASNSDPLNVDNEDVFFDHLYKMFSIKRVSAARMINSKGNRRGAISEIMISNVANTY